MEPLEVYGQEKVKQLLERSAHSKLLGNSILLEGSYGVGKERMAFWLAQKILCDSGTACGSCTPCTKVIRLTHPDLNWMIPAPAAEGSSAEDSSEGTRRKKLTERDKFLVSAVESKREKPFFVPRHNRPIGHSAESIRDLLLWCSKNPFEAERKVVIIRDADMMAPGIANLFLKLLEEPPLDTILLLTSTRPHRLLATVLSRCSSCRFPPVEDRHIEKVLVEYKGIRGDRVILLTRLAQGSLLRALELADGDDEVREEAIKLLGTAAIGRNREWYDLLMASITGRSNRNRGEVLDLTLFFMVLILRDLLVLSEGGDESIVVNVDRLDRIRKLGGKWGRERVSELILGLERIRRDLDYHVNTDLALWKALDSVRTCLHEGRPLL